MESTAFITGATGFAGRHLIDHLQGGSCTVCGTAWPEKPDGHLGFSQDRFYHMDICSVSDVEAAIKQTRPDYVYHLAAVSNVGYSWKMRRETVETNLMGTFNLMEAVRRFAPKARVLFISSSDIYGLLSPVEKRLDEKVPPRIVNPYAFTKVSGELLCEFSSRIENMDVIIARPFPHTGPGQSPDFVCSDWACQIAHIENGGEDPVIQVGNIEQKRDFTDVRDVVRAYRLLMEEGRTGEIYNICSGKAPSLKEILEALISMSDRSIEIRVDPQKLRKADIPLLLGDNSKISEEMGWEPEIPIEQTLNDLLAYWRERV